jgi:hypothetical protein
VTAPRPECQSLPAPSDLGPANERLQPEKADVPRGVYVAVMPRSAGVASPSSGWLRPEGEVAVAAAGRIGCVVLAFIHVLMPVCAHPAHH